MSNISASCPSVFRTKVAYQFSSSIIDWCHIFFLKNNCKIGTYIIIMPIDDPLVHPICNLSPRIPISLSFSLSLSLYIYTHPPFLNESN